MSVYNILFLSFYFTCSDACYLMPNIVYLCFLFIYSVLEKVILLVFSIWQLAFYLVDLILLFNFYFFNHAHIIFIFFLLCHLGLLYFSLLKNLGDYLAYKFLAFFFANMFNY